MIHLIRRSFPIAILISISHIGFGATKVYFTDYVSEANLVICHVPRSQAQWIVLVTSGFSGSSDPCVWKKVNNRNLADYVVYVTPFVSQGSILIYNCSSKNGLYCK